MTLASLVAAVLLSPAFAGAPPSYPTEKDLIAQAQAWVAAHCEKQKPTCQAAKDALAAYQALLPQTASCERGPCEPKLIRKLAADLFAIDQRVAPLPAPAAGAPNDLLRLSAMASARLSAAAARTAEPEAAAPPFRPETLAPKAVEAACLADPVACRPLRSAYEESLRLAPELAACKARPCDFPTVDALVVRAQAAVSDSLTNVPGGKVETLPIFSVVYIRGNEATALLTVLSGAVEAELKSATERFAVKVAAAERDPQSDLTGLPAEGAAITARYRDASVSADRLIQVLGYEKGPERRGAVNAQTLRLSGLRGRALALLTARGLKPGGMDLGVFAAALGPAGAVTKEKVPLSAPRATLLDRRTVPVVPGTGARPPPILPGKRGLLDTLLQANAKDPLKQIDALRRLGLTKTTGNPGLYAGLVYPQDTGTSCAIAAQVQVLRAHGLLPPGDPALQERELVAEAVRKGYKNKGTPKEYSAELLIEKGLLVDKRLKASWGDLEAAIRRGSVIEVGVDARKLWGMGTGSYLGHAILVTGAEVHKITGALLGVYINDTGDDPPKGGRFIAAKDFKGFWSGDYAEVR